MRRSHSPTSGHPVQPVDVQHSGVHSRRAADPRLVGRRVPAAAQLQHAILSVAERQVPDRSGAPVRHQSLPPCAGRRGCTAPDDGRRRHVRRQRPRRDAVGCLGPSASNATRLRSAPPAMTTRRRQFINNIIILYLYTCRKPFDFSVYLPPPRRQRNRPTSQSFGLETRRELL